MSNKNTASKLLEYWVSSIERFGLVLDDGSIVELRNQSQRPDQNAVVAQDDIDAHGDRVVATWHTHLKGNVNLSAADYRMFLGMPQCMHYIVTDTRVRSFVVRNNKVMLHEADCI